MTDYILYDGNGTAVYTGTIFDGLNLEDTRSAKIVDTRNLCHRTIADGFVWNGKLFGGKEEEIANIKTYLGHIALGGTAPTSIKWSTKDDQIVDMTITEFREFASSLFRWLAAVYSECNNHILAIQSFTTVNDIKAYDTSSIKTIAQTSLTPTFIPAGTYGDANFVPRLTVDAFGRITSILEVDTLDGTGVTDQLAIFTGTSSIAGLTLGSSLTINSGTLNIVGDGTGTVTSLIAGTGLTGGTITNAGTISLGTVGVAGTYNQVITDAYGRIVSGATSNSINPLKPTTSVTASTYNATTTDYYIGVNFAGQVTINLPAGENGLELIIKDESGNAGALLNGRIITLIPNGTQTIDNQNSAIIANNYDAFNIIFRGSGWWIK